MIAQTISLKLTNAIAILALLVGYMLAGTWWILPVLLVIVLFWSFTKDNKKYCPASGFLVVYFLLAANGILSGLYAGFMILACAASLASWDLAHFERGIAGQTVHKENKSLRHHHLQSLALTVFAGMLLAFIASVMHLQLPFWSICILIVFTFSGLFVVTRIDRK